VCVVCMCMCVLCVYVCVGVGVCVYVCVGVGVCVCVFNWDGEGTPCVVIIVKWLEREKQKLHTEVLCRGLFGSNNMRGQEKNLLTGG
jgi:hypothetical protein